MFLRPLVAVCCFVLIVGIGVLNTDKFDAATDNGAAETNFYYADDYENVNDVFYSTTKEESLSFSGNTSLKTLMPTYIPSGYKVNETKCTDEYIELVDENGGYIICQTDIFVSSETEKLTVVSKKIDAITVTVIANTIDEREAQKILNSIY